MYFKNIFLAKHHELLNTMKTNQTFKITVINTKVDIYEASNYKPCFGDRGIRMLWG